MVDQSKKSIRRFSLALVLTILTAFLALTGLFSILTGCGSGKTKNTHSGIDSIGTPTGPAPDNSAATNPSVADTAFQKDSTVRKP